MIRIVPLESRHGDIAPRLRQQDREEVRAMTGMSPEVALAFSIATASPGWAAEYHGRTEAVFGAGPGIDPAGPGVGRPWLLATDEAERHPVTFYRLSRGIVDVLRVRYGRLENWVSEENALSRQWLAWLGFHIGEPEPMGPFGRLFRRFWMEVEKKDVFGTGGGGRDPLRSGEPVSGGGGELGGQGPGCGGGAERRDRGGSGA